MEQNNVEIRIQKNINVEEGLERIKQKELHQKIQDIEGNVPFSDKAHEALLDKARDVMGLTFEPNKSNYNLEADKVIEKLRKDAYIKLEQENKTLEGIAKEETTYNKWLPFSNKPEDIPNPMIKMSKTLLSKSVVDELEKGKVTSKLY